MDWRIPGRVKSDGASIESKSIAPLTKSIVGRGIVGVTTGRSRVPVAGHREEDGGSVVVGGGT